MVPYTPGSPVDVLARLATQHAGARLGQTIVIDNRPGAGTTLGTKAAASADPDGYTILIAATSFVISSVLYPNPGYDLAKSFAPVAMLARSPQVMVIAPEVPAKTVAEFVAHAKANPNKLNFGFGLGTLPQILGETFKAVTKTDIVSIPYKGGAQAITDMLGGRIHMNFGTPPTLLPLIQQGKIRALAVTTDARYRDMPDVPTMIEGGPAAARTDLLGGRAGARRHAGADPRHAQRRVPRGAEVAGIDRQHGEARLRAGAVDARAIRRVPGRGDAEVAADREGVRRESGVTAMRLRACDRRDSRRRLRRNTRTRAAISRQADQARHPAGRGLADHGAGARRGAAAVGTARAAGHHREPAGRRHVDRREGRRRDAARRL